MEPLTPFGAVINYPAIPYLLSNLSLLRKLGLRLKVVALVDPATERALAVLQEKRDSLVASAYADTRVYGSLDDLANGVTPKEKPHAIIIGTPAMFRGSLQSGKDIEIQILKYFPGIPMFIEKPIATGPFEHVQDGYRIAKMIADAKTTCSVG